MHKFLTMTLVAAVAASALVESPALAGDKSARRVAAAPYTGAVVGTEATDGGYCLPEMNLGCMDFRWRRGERTVALEIKDVTGLPVYGAVGQQDADNRYVGELRYFCGKTPRPFKIDPRGGLLAVFIYDGGPLPGCPGVATSGKVFASFSR